LTEVPVPCQPYLCTTWSLKTTKQLLKKLNDLCWLQAKLAASLKKAQPYLPLWVDARQKLEFPRQWLQVRLPNLWAERLSRCLWPARLPWNITLVLPAILLEGWFKFRV